MSANTWLIIAIVGFSLSGIALIAAVILFIKLNVPAIIGDLTGRTVAREIKAMRETNKSSGDKRFRSSAVNIGRGTLTEKVEDEVGHIKAAAHISKRLDKSSDYLGEKRKTKSESQKTSDNDLNTIPQPTEKSTDVLRNNVTEGLRSEATEVLDDTVTEVLSKETEVLSMDTTILSTEEPHIEESIEPIEFKIVRDIIVTHSDEVIE